MRGKVSPGSSERRACGITPAYAGKRSGARFITAFIWDHPRVCGEKYVREVTERTAEGSPPRMRGKAPLIFCGICGTGITPAYAGKRPSGGHHRAAGGDHPRVCGEKSTRNGLLYSRWGSPPRMRGKVPECRNGGEDYGITPAYAGKRPHSLPAESPQWDHPRVCGEKLMQMLVIRRLLGSPPRMRGKEAAHVLSQLLSGITPAYAGKRHTGGTTCFCRKDHPRVCGEKPVGAEMGAIVPGSPPRMRGKEWIVWNTEPAERITPAYAGKRQASRRSSMASRDHPRVCGEKTYRSNYERCVQGSPPRMRGKVGQCIPDPAGLGITPAYAGKSSAARITSSSIGDHPRVCGEKELVF